MTLVVTHNFTSTTTESTSSGTGGGLGIVGPSEWNANHTLSGLATPVQGGTGISSGLGVPYFSATQTMSDSGTLTANALLVGGGANGAPANVSSLGTTSQVLHGNASGNPSWALLDLTSQVTGTLSTGNLPVATGSVFGVVKPDTTTVTISSGVLSAPGGGSVTPPTTFTLSSSTSTATAISILTSSTTGASQYAQQLALTSVWNDSGHAFDAPLFVSVTDTNSVLGSKMIDIQRGGNSIFAVDNQDFIQLKGTQVIKYASPYLLLNSQIQIYSGGGVTLTNTTNLGWGNGSLPTSIDTGFSRQVAQVIALTNGTTGTITGWMNYGGQARVSSDVTSTTTAKANITGLTFTPLANRNYSFNADLFVTDAAAGGVACTVNATSTTTTYTLFFDGYAVEANNKGYAQQTAFGNDVASTVTTGTITHVKISGTLLTSATAPSTVVIQFGQAVQNATQTIIKAGSFMWVHDMP